ncbi:MAG: hypothetical protein DK304_001168, partial [Chloroflexi bacterium]
AGARAAGMAVEVGPGGGPAAAADVVVAAAEIEPLAGSNRIN